MDKDMDLKFGNDIYEALNESRIPDKIRRILPDNFDDLEEDTVTNDEGEESEELS